jgi:hypothetical protein
MTWDFVSSVRHPASFLRRGPSPIRGRDVASMESMDKRVIINEDVMKKFGEELSAKMTPSPELQAEWRGSRRRR